MVNIITAIFPHINTGRMSAYKDCWLLLGKTGSKEAYSAVSNNFMVAARMLWSHVDCIKRHGLYIYIYISTKWCVIYYEIITSPSNHLTMDSNHRWNHIIVVCKNPWSQHNLACRKCLKQNRRVSIFLYNSITAAADAVISWREGSVKYQCTFFILL